MIAADLDHNVRLLEVSKAKNSPFGLLSQLTLAGLLQTASQLMQGNTVSVQGLGAALLVQKLQQTALHNGITQHGAIMAIMPDIQVYLLACHVNVTTIRIRCFSLCSAALLAKVLLAKVLLQIAVE